MGNGSGQTRGWTMPQVAARLAADLQEGWFVNLGIGLPTLVADALPKGREIILHTENGVLGLGPRAGPGEYDPDLLNAGKEYITLLPGGSFFSQAESFAMIRGGHLDAAVLGAFQVSMHGDLANWKAPSAPLGQVGGAMDLAVGSRRVFVLMEHCTRKGESKIVERCSFPVTARRCVRRVYTNLAVIDVTDRGLFVRELAPGVTLDDVQAVTAAPLEGSERSASRSETPPAFLEAGHAPGYRS